jgi:hypothetical protein
LATSLISVQGSGISTKPKTKDHAPKDVHGGSKFIVKLQLPTVPGNTKALIYDEKRSFQCAVRIPLVLHAILGEIESVHQVHSLSCPGRALDGRLLGLPGRVLRCLHKRWPCALLLADDSLRYTV